MRRTRTDCSARWRDAFRIAHRSRQAANTRPATRRKYISVALALRRSSRRRRFFRRLFRRRTHRRKLLRTSAYRLKLSALRERSTLNSISVCHGFHPHHTNNRRLLCMEASCRCCSRSDRSRSARAFSLRRRFFSSSILYSRACSAASFAAASAAFLSAYFTLSASRRL